MSGWSTWSSALLRERGRSLLGVLLLVAVASAAMALRTGSQDPNRIAGGALVLLAFALGPLMTGGVVSDDLGDGPMVLWLQNPVSPLGFYLTRLLVTLTTAVGALLALLLAVVSCLAAVRGTVALELLRLGPFLVPCTILAGLVTFAFSGLGSRRDGTLALLYLLLAVPGSLLLELAEDQGGALQTLAWVGLFPLNELQLLQDWILEGSGALPRTALFRVGVYGLAWFGAGAAATWRATRWPSGRD